MTALKYSRIPSYLIFDERTRRSGPITSVGHGANRSYEWSSDNQTEIDRGWITTGKDACELAQKLRLGEAAELDVTLRTYRAACCSGKDNEFGRAPETLIDLHGDLYGVPLWPCLLNTQGGPKRNSCGQILNVWGEPIKRLYSAGELGSIWGFLYQSGGNLAECLGLGRMAGTHAAAEAPIPQ